MAKKKALATKKNMYSQLRSSQLSKKMKISVRKKKKAVIKLYVYCVASLRV